MTVKNTIITLSKEDIMDDMTNKDEASAVAANVDLDKLAELKAKLEAKKTAEPKRKVVEQTRSINFGIVGSGQCGSRIAESFYKLGYDAIAINTAQQDLKFIELPESNKLLLNYGLGGAAKSLEIGRDAAETHKEQIAELINNQLADAQIFIFCTSLGGGSGAGSTETMIDVLSSIGKPILVITVLPMDAEDVQAKSNALQTLDKLLKEVKSKRIHNLICVDNAKIETIYRDVGQMDFFHIANRAIVEPLDVFNCQSARPSPSKSLDPMELSKLLIDGEGMTVYGTFNVENYEEDTALAEAVISNLNSNLLAGGFDIKQSKYVGFMLCASKKVWSKIPASSLNYANAMIADQCGSPLGIFRGIYEVDSEDDCVKVYSMFAGLGLPANRVEQLTKETKAHMEVVKTKDAQRNLSLNLDLGKDQVVSDAQKVKEKIAQKSSAFGKFLNQNVVDRRKS
jgi:cell division GTPase FtsZ